MSINGKAQLIDQLDPYGQHHTLPRPDGLTEVYLLRDLYRSWR
jgi:hypothetical protein